MGSIENNKVNLCTSCCSPFPNCEAQEEDIMFGDGVGDDNICACSEYKAIADRHPKDAGSKL